MSTKPNTDNSKNKNIYDNNLIFISLMLLVIILAILIIFCIYLCYQKRKNNRIARNDIATTSYSNPLYNEENYRESFSNPIYQQSNLDNPREYPSFASIDEEDILTNNFMPLESETDL